MTAQIAAISGTSSTGLLATILLMLENKTDALKKQRCVRNAHPQRIHNKFVDRPQFNIQQPRKITN